MRCLTLEQLEPRLCAAHLAGPVVAYSLEIEQPAAECQPGKIRIYVEGQHNNVPAPVFAAYVSIETNAQVADIIHAQAFSWVTDGQTTPAGAVNVGGVAPHLSAPPPQPRQLLASLVVYSDQTITAEAVPPITATELDRQAFFSLVYGSNHPAHIST